jgi:hypothetical protein
MDHPIYKAIVLVHNQEECDVAREICLKYSLRVWKDIDNGFEYIEYDDPDDDDNDDDEPTYLQYKDKDSSRDDNCIGFYVDTLENDKDEDDYNLLSIEEFESLANSLNPIYNNMEDILSKLKEINNILNNK